MFDFGRVEEHLTSEKEKKKFTSSVMHCVDGFYKSVRTVRKVPALFL